MPPDSLVTSLGPLDPAQRATPPWAYFAGPRHNRPTLIVDDHGVNLADPDGYFVGFDAPRGGSGQLGRLVYAERTPASRQL